MTSEQLQSKLDDLQKRYDALSLQRNDLNAELLRLEGEFRAVNALKDELIKEKDNATAIRPGKPTDSNVDSGKQTVSRAS